MIRRYIDYYKAFVGLASIYVSFREFKPGGSGSADSGIPSRSSPAATPQGSHYYAETVQKI